ncbi:MAG TPA: UDP-N-acetylmuramoyl-L-alanine--D-glutamate ligase [Firmicutes bacterium]|jgi:UDP-N-acetylmuramoylalanine--D-glutamate ligase|nr:UDP-N-acetylmuramoyl-L-alanine--D-glutamate ligase [Bacillota bacterium]
MRWEGKHVALIGLGISNMAVARYLVANGAIVTACDQKSAAELGARYVELTKLHVEFQLGPGYLANLERFDALFLTPGVPKHLPELRQAQAAGVLFSSEMNLFFDICRAHIIGITGSSGKTTTTTLLGELLSAADYSTHVGGNIGRPLVEVAGELEQHSWAVMELSSFQLELLQRSPEIALITNITPNHLDIHLSMDDYIQAKSHVFTYQHPDDWAVFNYDNETTRRLAAKAPGRVAWFSRKQVVDRGACVIDQRIMIANGGTLSQVCHTDEIKLMGQHNVENVLAAIAVADLVGCSIGAMRDVVTSFTGVEHRLELVRTADGIAYYNDSKATTPAGTIAALNAFNRPVVLIAGGYDKNLPFDELASTVVQKAKHVVLLGATSDKIASAVVAASATTVAGTLIPQIEFAASLEEAVILAKAVAVPGDVILLSPACASYDMYSNFEERGRHFREIVGRLTEAETPTRS